MKGKVESKYLPLRKEREVLKKKTSIRRSQKMPRCCRLMLKERFQIGEVELGCCKWEALAEDTQQSKYMCKVPLRRMRSWSIGVPAIVKQRTRAKKSLPSTKRRNLGIEKQKNSQVNCESGCILDKKIAARKAEKK